MFILMMYFTRNNPRDLLNQLREKEDENFKLKNRISVIKEVFKTYYSDNIKLEIIKILIHYYENNDLVKLKLFEDLIRRRKN